MVEARNNPYEYRTIKWALMEEDWSDLTVAQIAEVFDTVPRYIYDCLSAIKAKTGYVVPHKRGKAGRKPEK